jgi:dTDP-4-dehydrorhamnose 3,5-epimerase
MSLLSAHRRALPQPLIDGVALLDLDSHVDRRGALTTLFVSGPGDTPPVQWNVMRSVPGVIRGIHVHSDYSEYYVSLGGPVFVHLHDARRSSASFGRSANFWLEHTATAAIRVPAGVAHGVAFPEGGLLLCGLSAVWSGAGEFGCRWDDERLAVPWPIKHPILSDRDSSAGSYADMVSALERADGGGRVSDP